MRYRWHKKIKIMSTIKVYNFREAEKILRKNGYWLQDGGKGSHRKYTNALGAHISLPSNGKDFNRMVWQRIIKEARLIL